MIQIIIAILLGLGLFFIIEDLIKLPYIKTSKTIKNLSKRQKNKTSNLEVLLSDFALWISRHLHLNEYKKIQLASDLQTAGINITPELHIANSLIKSVICGLLIVPAFFIFPLISPLVVALTFAMYFKESKGIQEKIRQRRMKIEYELPRLVFTIEKTLSHSRDVLAILDDFRQNTSDELKNELDITVADMRSGNYESALTRLESRVGSAMLSDVVRGLISVIRGDNTLVYWQSLSIKFADIQRQQLKAQAQKVPGKVKRLSMVLLFCFIAVYLVVITAEVMNGLGAMLG